MEIGSLLTYSEAPSEFKALCDISYRAKFLK
jgi:hypothetical protein